MKVSPKGRRQKGSRGEREVVEILKAAGVVARRVPLSGADANFKGDVHFKPPNCPAYANRWGLIECKWLASGFKFLYRHLAGNDALCVRADNQEWLVVVPLREWAELVAKEGANDYIQAGPKD
jgi:hypothetical protein